ncbi:MAG: TspO/MBR family protein [Hyphomicrobiaceae bacterium]
MTPAMPRPFNGPAMAIGATVFIALTLGAAFLGSQFPPGDWYEALNKPSWTPPNWLFGPVWGLLYIMIAAAGFIAWRRGASWGTITIWVIALLLNAMWTPMFFGAEQPVGALVIIGLLWLAIVAFIALSRRRASLAAWLFVPYLLWVSYALSLNAGIIALNP